MLLFGVFGSTVPAGGRHNPAALTDETVAALPWTRPPADSKTHGSSCGSKVAQHHSINQGSRQFYFNSVIYNVSSVDTGQVHIYMYE